MLRFDLRKGDRHTFVIKQVTCFECGEIREVKCRINNLPIANRCNSCSKKVHGDSRKRLYKIWQSMLARCRNPQNHAYANYGGKGLTVFEGWHDYIGFRDWALSHGYGDNLTIDKICDSSGYSPLNCQWIPKSENTKKGHLGRKHIAGTTKHCVVG